MLASAQTVITQSNDRTTTIQSDAATIKCSPEMIFDVVLCTLEPIVIPSPRTGHKRGCALKPGGGYRMLSGDICVPMVCPFPSAGPANILTCSSSPMYPPSVGVAAYCPRSKLLVSALRSRQRNPVNLGLRATGSSQPSPFAAMVSFRGCRWQHRQ